MDEKDDERQPDEPGGWLPPEPPGGAPPTPPPPPQYQPPPPPQPPAPPPPPAAPPHAQPPPPAAPAGAQHLPPPAPPGQPPPPPGQPPPYYGYPTQGYPPQQPHPGYGWQALPPQPPNNDAMVGFTCAVIGAVLLFFTAGLSTIVSLILGIVAIPYARKGKKRVEAGETQKHRDLAKAGYIVGILTVVFSILATIAWVLIFALVDWDEIEDSGSGGDDFEFELRAAVRVAAGAVRLLG